MKPPKVTRSEYVYRGRVVTLRRDYVVMEDGSEAVREVVEHRGAVAVVPKLDAGTILLVRQYRQAVGEMLLEIPAGTLEEGESPDACAARELEEEVGYRARRLRRLFHQYLAPGYSSEVLHVYVGEELVPSSAHPDADEELETVAVPIQEVERMILAGEIRDAKSIAGLLVALHLDGNGGREGASRRS
ncbi:MAG: NUDIX hydrolase [Chthonomonadales bacterium]